MSIHQLFILELNDWSKEKLIERFTIVVNDAELGYSVKALTGINMDTKKRDHIIEANCSKLMGLEKQQKLQEDLIF